MVAQRRFARLRQNSRLLGSISASAARRLNLGMPRTVLSGATVYPAPGANAGSASSTVPLGSRGRALSLDAPVKTDLKLASPSAFSVSETNFDLASVNRLVRWTKANKP